MFWNRAKEVKELIEQYFKATDESLAEFDTAMRIYQEQGPGDAFREHDKLTHRWESKADDLRWDIEVMLYSRSILPESRDDILNLLENFDHIPNLAENITFQLDTQKLRFPPSMMAQLERLVRVNLEAYHLARRAVDFLFTDPSRVGAEIEPVDVKESESDGIERDLIVAIFQQDLPGSVPLQLREIVQRIGDISDSCEKLARRMEIIALKKRI